MKPLINISQEGNVVNTYLILFSVVVLLKTKCSNNGMHKTNCAKNLNDSKRIASIKKKRSSQISLL